MHQTRHHLKTVIAVLLATALWTLAPSGARADFKTGWEAYEKADFATALKEWTAAAEGGDSLAQYNIGVLYDEGKGVERSHTEAVGWWLKAAKNGLAAAQGLARSQYTLGKMYIYGLGVPKHEKKAAEWITKAAMQGDARAQYNLGKFFRDGTGVQADAVTSVSWFLRAAERGHVKAQSKMGTRYAKGEGTARDDVEALKWSLLAAQQFDVTAVENVKALKKRLNDAEIEEAKKRAQAWVPKGNKAK